MKSRKIIAGIDEVGRGSLIGFSILSCSDFSMMMSSISNLSRFKETYCNKNRQNLADVIA
jgi:ribonuclease HII